LKKIEYGTKAAKIPKNVLNALPLHADAMLYAAAHGISYEKFQGRNPVDKEEFRETPIEEVAGLFILRGAQMLTGMHRQRYDSEPDLPVESFIDESTRLRRRHEIRKAMGREDVPYGIAKALSLAEGEEYESFKEELVNRARDIVISPEEVARITDSYGPEMASIFPHEQPSLF